MNKENTYSNIITPPDFPDDKFSSVLLIDPEWSELEDLTLFLKTATQSFNVYVYRPEMRNIEWVDQIIQKENPSIIINTVNNENSAYKDKLAVKEGVWYYGHKNFLMNRNRIEKPIDFFVQHINLIGEDES